MNEEKKIKNNWLNNRYVLNDVIGQGGFGTIYKAFDTLLNCYVAIKEAETGPLMTCEAQIMRKLRNVPYIARYKDSFTYGDKSYIVMKLLKGQSLSALQKSKKKMTAQELMIPLENILIAMDKMHELGYIHRDISPGNLFYTEDGELILIDFGTATSLDPESELYNSTFFEHKGFQAPENREISEQGPWTDIYSFCATVFYLITGDGVPDAQSRGIMDAVPGILLKSSLSAKQQNALMNGLQADRANRCQNAEILRELLYGQDKDVHFAGEVHYSAGTDIGSKKVNQDNLLVDQLFYFEGQDFVKNGTLACISDELYLAAVCDGVGGAASGELASRAVVQALKHFLEQHRQDPKLPERLLEELLDQINEKIISLGKKIGQTGTTLSLLLWKGSQYYIVNIGDSPIFLLRDRKLIKLSEEQTMAYAKIAEGMIPTPRESHTLVNYLGKGNVAGSQMMSYRHGYMKKNDVFLLCSDGVTNKLETDLLKRLLRKPGETAIEKIFHLLRKKTNNDNCTAVIIRF